MISTTLIIIILTAIISFTAFSNQKTINDLIFYPPAVSQQNQWYRFWSCALIHADIAHLAFNMFSLYMFGEMVEKAFEQIFPGTGKILYVALYLVSQFICLVPTYMKHKDDYSYRSLGASGAVSAVVFAGIFLYPTAKIGLFIIPPIIPGFIFGPLYLVVSAMMAKKGGDNINHSAHIWGAIAGIVFLIIASYSMSTFDPIKYFISQVTGFFS
ncbi:MAG TPA: rhomboid family intramembrane serine protease [Segetibacter sp.]|jgi:membrane associated rhomboid family serine protease